MALEIFTYCFLKTEPRTDREKTINETMNKDQTKAGRQMVSDPAIHKMGIQRSVGSRQRSEPIGHKVRDKPFPASDSSISSLVGSRWGS
ncbi:unnamed protein product [Nezara viridula]|uniref:Uncharacterized protein n=1 Tax=Nezara viridula TaxID=85310 RepID=A0A9P0HM28_NEZVI|nr:unnamed protein product [Nezara viridula]